jgi:hypothetical protein
MVNATAVRKSQRGRRMWPSLATASRVSDVANVALIFSLVLSVVSTCMIVWMGNVKEIYWDDARDKSGEKIRELDVAVAEANVRAAEANKIAEQERLERVRIEERIAPRRLSAEQQNTLAHLFGQYPGATIRVSSYSLDLGSAFLGQQFIDIAARTNLLFDDRRMSEGALGSIMFGISITGTDQDMVSKLLVALSGFGLGVNADPPPPSAGISLGGQDALYSAKVFIGVKPLTP